MIFDKRYDFKYEIKTSPLNNKKDWKIIENWIVNTLGYYKNPGIIKWQRDASFNEDKSMNIIFVDLDDAFWTWVVWG